MWQDMIPDQISAPLIINTAPIFRVITIYKVGLYLINCFFRNNLVEFTNITNIDDTNKIYDHRYRFQENLL